MPSVCSVDSCSKPHLAKGWCKLHYVRMKNTGSLEILPREPSSRVCSLEGCSTAHYGKGLCKHHYTVEYYSANKDVINQASREYYAANRERILEQAAEYRANNPEWARRGARVRRARKHGGDRSPYTEREVLDFHGTTCHICSEEIDMTAPRRTGLTGWERGLHFDHVETLASGGPDAIGNIRPAHGLCNLKKSKPRKDDNG